MGHRPSFAALGPDLSLLICAGFSYSIFLAFHLHSESPRFTAVGPVMVAPALPLFAEGWPHCHLLVLMPAYI